MDIHSRDQMGQSLMRSNLTIVVGPVCSGKTTFVEEMVSNGYNRIVSYTNRSARQNEIDGVDYNFSDMSTYISMTSENSAILHRQFYIPSEGSMRHYWYYDKDIIPCVDPSAAGEEPIGNYVLILDLQGLVDFRELFGDVAQVIFVDAPRHILLQRAVTRGGRSQDAKYRLEKEDHEFDQFRRSKHYDLRVSTVSPEIVVGSKRPHIHTSIPKQFLKDY